MIVKNEREVIKKSLASVKDIVDYWVIFDTGSTDGTQEIIKEFMREIPGELYERPWVNFGYNRNEALAAAKGKGDYVLFMDADEELVFSDSFTMPYLDKDSYLFTMQQVGKGVEYKRALLVNNRLDWKWEGVLHEVVNCPEARTRELMQGVVALSHTCGFRSKDPQKYLKDAQILEKALEEDPTNARYVYYLAQSYFNVPDYPSALKWYEKRATMGGWDEEVFFSLYCVGMLQTQLKFDPEVFTKNLCKAFLFRPTRAEPLFRLVNYYIATENYFLGYLLAKFALSIPLSNDSVFVEKFIYDWGILLQLAQCSYNLGQYEESCEAMKKLLLVPDLPPDIRVDIDKNLQLFRGVDTQLHRE